MKKVKRALLNTFAKVSVASSVVGSFLFGLASPIFAQALYPSWVDKITNIFTGGSPVSWARARVQWALTILFVVVFVVAIIYSAMAAMKFISSQGDSSKLEESKAAVKAILMGFAAMIIAIVGIFIIFWLFGAGAEWSNTINNTPEFPPT